MKEFIRHDTLLTDDYTYKVLIDTLIDPSHLTFFKFIEDWYYDARRFTFVKKIMAISPVEKVFIELPDGNYDEKGLFSKFWIKNTQAKPEKLELLYTMEYEFPIYNTEFIKMQERIENGDLMDISYYEKENAPYWNSYARTIFINSLITKIRNKEIKAYNYQSKEPMLDDADLFYALGGRVDTIQYMDPITEELILLTVSNQPEVKNISSIIFKEELYWDKDKHYFEKKVISIAPVVKRYIFDSNTGDITVKQTPCCVVYFNNN